MRQQDIRINDSVNIGVCKRSGIKLLQKELLIVIECLNGTFPASFG
jgi:hypothetical protein